MKISRILFRLKILLLVAGAVALVQLIRAFEAAELVDAVAGIGFYFVPVLVAEFLFNAVCTLGWSYTIPPALRPKFVKLFAIRLAGTAINQVTPTATVGGEPMKAAMLAPAVPLHEGIASVLVAQGCFMIAQATLVVVGLLVVVATVDLPLALIQASAAFAAVFALGVWFFFRIQRRGLGDIAEAAGRLWSRANSVAPRAEKLIAGIRKVDASLRSLRHERPTDFARAIGWHIAARLVSIAQAWFILRGLGIDAGVEACILIQAASLMIDIPSSVIPGRLGILEGGRMVIFNALKYGTAPGLAFALAQRVAQIITIAGGLAALAFLRFPAGSSTREERRVPGTDPNL